MFPKQGRHDYVGFLLLFFSNSPALSPRIPRYCIQIRYLSCSAIQDYPLLPPD